MNLREHEQRDDMKVWLSQDEVTALLDAADGTQQRIALAAIMRLRGLDIPAEVVSARVNATQEVIGDYYDERTPRERMEQRREKLGNLE